MRNRPQATIARSRLSRVSTPVMPSCTGILNRSMFDDTVIVQVEMRKLPVAVRQFELNFPLRRARTAAHLGKLVLEAMGNIDSGPVLGTADRILNRLATRVRDPGNNESSAPCPHIDVEFYRRKNRLVNLGEGRHKHRIDSRHRVGILA